MSPFWNSHRSLRVSGKLRKVRKAVAVDIPIFQLDAGGLRLVRILQPGETAGRVAAEFIADEFLVAGLDRRCPQPSFEMPGGIDIVRDLEEISAPPVTEPLDDRFSRDKVDFCCLVGKLGTESGQNREHRGGSIHQRARK